MVTFFRVLAARVRGFLRPDDLEREFDEELAAHLEMAEEDKVRQGLSREEARRKARAELGGLTQLREAGREARGLPWLGTFWLDVKLGLRMLRKSWGLTLVGGLAMTVAIGIGAAVFAFFDIVLSGTLPLDEGDRVIALQTWDERTQRRHGTSLADFERWRRQPRSVEDVGAFRTIGRNLMIGSGPASPVSIAEMSASGFELTRVAPFLGRFLTPEDELPAASPVVVIGHDIWQSRFSADRKAVGRTVRLGDTTHTIVGVMPEGFAFPVNHQLWTPLRPDRSASVEEGGPFDVVFARLAPGATLEGARSELSALGLLPATTAASTEAKLRPRAVPYAFSFDDEDDREEIRTASRIVLLFVILLLVPPCANIAILVYARTVTRQEEFAARYVLGASRGRIVAQIFIEVLVLALVAAGVALLLVRLATAQLDAMNPEAPFWIDFDLSVPTILFAALLAVVAAMISGLVPALRSTGHRMQSGLHTLGRRSGPRLGATWTALVIAQIAFSTAALPPAVEMAWGTLRTGVLGPGFPAEEYLTARIAMDRETPDGTSPEGEPRPLASRFDALRNELIDRLLAEPGVLGVTAAAAMPGDEPWANVEVEGIPRQEDGLFAGSNLIRFNRVDTSFFDTFNVPILMGRAFGAGDLDPGQRSVIVNQMFAETLLGDATGASVGSSRESLLGLRVRYTRREGEDIDSESPTWYEIVGVVANLPAHATGGTMYHPMAPGETHPTSLALHMGSTPSGAADRLREITTALDPSLRVEEILPLSEIYREKAVGNNMGASALAAVMLSVLLLSAAGIYAFMSFTVNLRRREIGIRSALGAQPGHLLAGTFRRAAAQLGAGAAAGILPAILLGYYFPIELIGGWEVPGVIPATAGIMMMIGLLAAIGPARRGLRVDPIEELREG